MTKSVLITLLWVLFLSGSVRASDITLVINGNITDYEGNQYSAFTIKNGLFETFYTDYAAIPGTVKNSARIIDARFNRIVPGLNDSHLHVVRGGRFYNLELRWEGVTSLKEGLAMISRQAARTPEGQWVRVIGGWSPYQFTEQRLPTPQELTAAAPDVPVFVLHLYSTGIMNKKALEVLGITRQSEAPPGSYYEKDASGNPTGVLVANPNPMLLYKTIAALPQLSVQEQVNSSMQFFNQMLQYGVTSAVDAGGGGHAFPQDYQASTQLAQQGDLPLRISNYLFPQTPDKEMISFMQWMDDFHADQNLHQHLSNGFVIEGGGELLTYQASDYENFRAARPELPERAEHALEEVVRLHLLNRWPFRLHATYDESISRILNVLEKVNQTQPVSSVRWIIDHAETISDDNIEKIAALGGAVAVQGRMAFAGEDFLARYGKQQTARTPPLKKLLEAGIDVGLGTDGTRVSSFNPWATYYWAVSGKTVGGTPLIPKQDLPDRLTALRLFTRGSAALSGEAQVKGSFTPGQYADFAILNQDILHVDAERLLSTRSLLTVVGGDIQYADPQVYSKWHKPLPQATPLWSPVNLPLKK